MKKILLSTIAILTLLFTTNISSKQDNQYIVIAWNDLGMHCSNKDFSSIAVLPPYNNLYAQVIKVGNATTMPSVITTDIKVKYEIPGNTYSVGKTNFWTYSKKLFGVTLADNIGLKGAGLSGYLNPTGNYFNIEGIPITPYSDSDLVNENPYQLGLVTVYDNNNNVLATTQPVIPVSNEITCVSSGCHTSENDIISKHGEGLSIANKPYLCGNCHATNALGTKGNGEAPIFSRAIHSSHSTVAKDCYNCHPGPKTQCFRDAMYKAKKKCTDCHGTMANIATTIRNGRRPWLDEPTCEMSGCHASQYAVNAKTLYRNSKGHGGLYCSACHGSPHAILPTVQANDNVQNNKLQGYSGTLDKCEACHGVVPEGPGPHSIAPSEVKVNKLDNISKNEILQNYPNPFTGNTQFNFNLIESGFVKLEVLDINGQYLFTGISEYLPTGSFSTNLNFNSYNNGVYICILRINGKSYTKLISKN